VRVGWVERVSLPDLGLWSLAAKVDTGARTSALHVRSVEAALSGLDALGPDALSVVLPPVHRTGDLRRVRVMVVDWVAVRDTSGRLERRPLVETVLEMGPLRRTIRLTLTDRGDMRYQMLVGRTAIPPGVLVDPAARFLLRNPLQLTSGRRGARRNERKI
jgi:hypothetical protein